MSPEAVDYAVLKRLLRDDFRPYRAQAFKALIFMIIAALATTAATWIIKLIVDDVFVAQNQALVGPIAIGIVVVYAIKGASTYFSTAILSKLTADLATNLRDKMIGRLLEKPITFFDETEASAIINRVVQTTKAAGDLVRNMLTVGLKDFLTVIFLGILMIYQDWLLTITLMIIGPIAIWGVSVISRRLRNSVQSEFNLNGHFIQLLFERFQGIRLIKSYQMEATTKALFAETTAAIGAHTARVGRVSALRSPLMETLGGVAVAAIIVYAGYAINAGRASAGEIFLIITAFLTAYEPLKNLSKFRIELSRQTLPLGEYYQMLDRDATPVARGRDFDVRAGQISFDAVSFGYETDQLDVLNAISFEAPSGKTTAIVGPSGAGKSTLFSLILGYYQPRAGALCIDGVDIATVNPDALRRHIAPISQDTTIFTGTIYDNIALGNPLADPEAVMRAAEAAQMSEFLSRMPEGIYTRIGDGEASLSGGQRQRLGIARAILKDAPILLLDEATSSLDSASEAKVQTAIKNASVGKTVLVIAHRLSTVRDADQIIVMQDGHVIDTGTHSQLIAKGGLYAELDALQSSRQSTA